MSSFAHPSPLRGFAVAVPGSNGAKKGSRNALVRLARGRWRGDVVEVRHALGFNRMGTRESARNTNGDDGAGDAMDRLIRRLRRRFRACESLPLFPEPSPAPATAAPPPPPGFFQLPDVGAQLRFDDPRRG